MIKGKLARDVTVQPLALARLLHLPPSDQLSTRCNVQGSSLTREIGKNSGPRF